MPKRPLVATFLTVAALALLLSFKTPDVAGLSPLASSGTGGSPGTQAAYTGQLTGNAIQTPFGIVQVQVTMQNGTITDVQALQLPSDRGRTAEISASAGPRLRSEVLKAQSAQIDTISGATYTSYGYIQSLQSALDQAR
jgi:uncharacterized protein with FMN-binding domain